MKKLILILLAALVLTGCAAPSAQTVETVETTPPTETTLPPDPMEELLSTMTLRQKVGQLFITRAEQLVPESGFVTEVTRNWSRPSGNILWAASFSLRIIS